MRIEVTREIIEGTSGRRGDSRNCVCAIAIHEATGREVSVGVEEGLFLDGAFEGFYLDPAGIEFVRRYIRYGKQREITTTKKRLFRKPLVETKVVQPTGSFEISWNPPPKNWEYREQTKQEKEMVMV